MTALWMATKLKATGFGTNVVARELALDLGEAAYRPDAVEHIPGLSNEVPDYLSRLLQPGPKKDVPCPSAWQDAKEDVAEPRDAAWYAAGDLRRGASKRERAPRAGK